jgi:hypothetical protein
MRRPFRRAVHLDEIVRDVFERHGAARSGGAAVKRVVSVYRVGAVSVTQVTKPRKSASAYEG